MAVNWIMLNDLKKACRGFSRFIRQNSSPKKPEYRNLNSLKSQRRAIRGMIQDVILNQELHNLKSGSFLVLTMKSVN